MFKIKNNELGVIMVSTEVIETIAGVAAMDCYGLVGMVPQNIQTGLSDILRLDSVRKGVEVHKTEDGVEIDLYCIVGYGIKISEVALNVMQKVSYVLENNAGIPVAKVNVNVRGVKVIQ
jgi:uncharacterized alkaline shock family protein YloU